MKSNKIIITIKDNKMEFRPKKPLTFEDLIQLTQTLIIGQARAIVDKATEDQKTEAKESLYDAMNQAFSRTLEFFAPELELRSDLTAQAILEAENAIIERKFKEVKK